MAYMLVIVTAYPNRAVELIKYQQIISRAVTKEGPEGGGGGGIGSHFPVPFYENPIPV